MSNPDGPGPDPQSQGAEPDTLAAEQYAADFETEVISTPWDAEADSESARSVNTPGERRFTAPSGMDAGSTQVIGRAPDPATEIIDMGAAGVAARTGAQFRTAAPREIPPRRRPKMPIRSGKWGWVLAVLLVIAALAAVAILGTLLLGRANDPKASHEDRVRATINAGANVISYLAFDPRTRSTRSFDLEFRDDQWKICQAPG